MNPANTRQQLVEETIAITNVRAWLDALSALVMASTKQFNRSRTERQQLWDRIVMLATTRVDLIAVDTPPKRPAKPRAKAEPASEPAPGTANPSPALIH